MDGDDTHVGGCTAKAEPEYLGVSSENSSALPCSSAELQSGSPVSMPVDSILTPMQHISEKQDHIEGQKESFAYPVVDQSVSGSTLTPASNERIFPCHICAFAASSQAELNDHCAVHYRFCCELCLKRFKTKKLLHRHSCTVQSETTSMDFRHDQVSETSKPTVERKTKKLLICKICHHVAATKDEYYEHQKKFHNPKFSCPDCNFCCEIKNHYDYHYSSVHSGERKYRCTQCSYKCITRTMLINHMKTHKNDFHCASCSFSTKDLSVLRAHTDEEGHLADLLLDTSENLPGQDVIKPSRKSNHGTKQSEKNQKRKRNMTQISASFNSSVEEFTSQTVSQSTHPESDMLRTSLKDGASQVRYSNPMVPQLFLPFPMPLPLFPYGSPTMPSHMHADLFQSHRVGSRDHVKPAALGRSPSQPVDPVIKHFCCNICSFEANSDEDLTAHFMKMHRLKYARRLTAENANDSPILPQRGSYDPLLGLLALQENAPNKPMNRFTMVSDDSVNASFVSPVQKHKLIAGDRYPFAAHSRSVNSSSPLRMASSLEVSPLRMKDFMQSSSEKNDNRNRETKDPNFRCFQQSSHKIKKVLEGQFLEPNVCNKNNDSTPLDLSVPQNSPRLRNEHEDYSLVSARRSRRKGKAQKLDSSAVVIDEAETDALNENVLESSVICPPLHAEASPFTMEILHCSEPSSSALSFKNTCDKNETAVEKTKINGTSNGLSTKKNTEKVLQGSLCLLADSLPMVSRSEGKDEHETLSNITRTSELCLSLSSPCQTKTSRDRVADGSNSCNSRLRDGVSQTVSGNFSSRKTSVDKRGTCGHWMFECVHCCMSFKDSAMHQLHMAFHNLTDPLQCNFCGQKSENYLKFYKHLGEVAHSQVDNC